MLAKLSGLVYLAAAGMLYGLWRLWQGKEPFGSEDVSIEGSSRSNSNP
jgi:hypothetical protein